MVYDERLIECGVWFPSLSSTMENTSRFLDLQEIRMEWTLSTRTEWYLKGHDKLPNM